MIRAEKVNNEIRICLDGDSHDLIAKKAAERIVYEAHQEGAKNE